MLPTCHLFDVLQKFDGKTVVEGRLERRLYRIIKLPKYLILHYKRFTKNEFFREKNPTIVNFPLNNLDLSPYYFGPDKETTSQKYDLLGNICHVGQKPEGGIYKIHVRHPATQKWYPFLIICQVRDLGSPHHRAAPRAADLGFRGVHSDLQEERGRSRGGIGPGVENGDAFGV